MLAQSWLCKDVVVMLAFDVVGTLRTRRDEDCNLKLWLWVRELKNFWREGLLFVQREEEEEGISPDVLGSSVLRGCAIAPMEDQGELVEKNKSIAPREALLQWSEWQLLDSILPTGGFAHSFGLEAAIQACIISDPEDLKTYIVHVLDNTGSLLLPFVYSATVSPTMANWHKLEKLLDATLTNEVGRKASTSQGSALMRVAAAVFTEIPSLKMMRDASLGSGAVSFHHAPVFGLICGLLGLGSGASQRAYMFITMRDIISAATRLNLVGPLGAAVMQHQIASVAEELSKKWMDRKVDEACQCTPLLDTVQGCHRYLFSRLFCS
ncbi:Urease accessory protein UreF [Dillenia turbinata]|uniref:Urease accessory protein UreF n=1 Tax=Dillenia turbinata TaxID=194707 RepID=A0AAN8V2Q2_9MAGN